MSGAGGNDTGDGSDLAVLRAERDAARDEARRARERLEFLVGLGRSVVDVHDPVEVMDRVLHLAVPRVADAGLAMLPEADGLRRVAVAHRDPEAEALGREAVLGTLDRFERNSPAVEAFRAGALRVRRSSEVADTSQLPEFLRRTVESYGLRAWIAVPIKAGREVLGVIALGFNDSDAVENDEGIALAAEVAGRTASGLIDAGRVEQEKRVTVALQTAVLPPALPRVNGWELAARYLPAQSDRAVGGDWYDALVLADGRITASIGDVTGHGVDAAATMGQLRNALRAYAAEGHGPGASLELLGRLVELTGEEQYASVAAVAVHPLSGLVEWASAGHLPMLHVRPERAHVLDAPHGILLGAVAADAVPTARLRLAPGESLVLYTDGLVERRGEDLAASIDALGSRLVAAGGSAEDQCDAALRSLDGGPCEDDVCVLVIRRL